LEIKQTIYPGITKVGNKTASKWLNHYGSLENVLKNIDEITGVVGQNLREEQDVLQRNLFLVSLKKDIELTTSFNEGEHALNQ
jgi:DNA polymerase-1